MRQKKHGIKAAVKRGMNGALIVLFLLAVGKGLWTFDWRQAGDRLFLAAEDCASSFAVSLWKQSYPAAGYSEKEKSTDQNTGHETPWYLRLVINQVPLFRLTGSAGQKKDLPEELDPSYKKYLQMQDFYQEHEDLFRYGLEDTMQQAENQPDTGEKPIIETITENTTPARIPRIDRQVLGTQYVKEQLADYDFLMKHFYSVHTSTTAGRDLMDSNQFLSEDLSLQGGNENPQILIYHTHSQETYADFGPEHPDGTVVGIGDYLTELLTQKGYNVIHDTSVYDLQGNQLDRNKAYTYALEGITGILQKNPSIEVVLDIHRDGVGENVRLVSEVNGKPTAQIMFFNGLSRTPTGPIEYLPNPYLEDNLAFSLQMQLDADAYYPGYTRKIYLKGLRYNMHLRPKSALIEVGAQNNTYEEARNAMEPLADLLDMILQGS